MFPWATRWRFGLFVIVVVIEVKPSGALGTAVVAITTQDTGATLVSGLPFSIVSFLIGLGNVRANAHKPVSLPIARAYDRFLGDKIEVLNKKKLMVDALMEARVLNKLKGADSAAFDNDPSLTQEQVEFMK